MKVVSRYFAVRDGKVVEVGAHPSLRADAPFVHQDSFKAPLRHPKTGEMVESMTRWNQINKEHGLRVVGNDWVGQDLKHDVPDRITDEKIGDAFERAWAVETDPDKRRQQRYREIREAEKFYQHQRGGYEIIKNLREIREMQDR